ncbi:hypothetical protein C8R48DRAFT_673458 [Suillus tomentosus]|nr:hypothetical protein C8R48DRAFT_673458 [Suillus tomentosus]
MSTHHYKCSCAHCSQHRDGFMYQTRQVITKHAKKYPPVLKPLGVDTNADAGANSMNDASRSSSESEGTDHRERPEIPPQVREDEYDFEFQHMDDQHAEEQPQYPAEQQAPVQELQYFNFRPVAWPDVQWITQYAICPKCWKHFTPAQLKERSSPECTVPDCQGVLYNEHTDAKGKHVRTSKKIMSHVSLVGSLHRQNEDKDYVMTDMHDDMLWHELETNTVHEIGELGTICDCPQDNQPATTKLTEHQYDLHLTLNIDCNHAGSKRAEHSSNQPLFGAIYSQADGTQEWSEVLNANWVKIDVYGEEEFADVFADHKALACDMPASHKCNGRAGHSHDFHPCYNNSWTNKNNYHMLCQSFYSKDATPAHQVAMLQDHGVRFSILNVISGWLPLRKSALDFMHCIFLGIILHLFMHMLFGGYMLLGMGGINSLK